eukprot:scaffold731_cov261-Pinguiococcus_pyrenoidosus.AAC.9
MLLAILKGIQKPPAPVDALAAEEGPSALRTATEQPSLARRLAVVRPTMPAPTTTTLRFCIISDALASTLPSTRPQALVRTQETPKEKDCRKIHIISVARGVSVRVHLPERQLLETMGGWRMRRRRGGGKDRKGTSSIKSQESIGKSQASSIKHRASSIEHQASSIKHQASSIRHQASSIKHQASRTMHQDSRIMRQLQRTK